MKNNNRNMEIEKQLVLAMIIRGFFQGYTSGILDSHALTVDQKQNPQMMKRIMVHHYEDIFPAFQEENIMTIARINFNEVEFLNMVHRQNTMSCDGLTGTQMLAMACGSDAMTRSMIEEYKFHFNYLLSGHLPTIDQQMAHFMDTEPIAESLPVDTVIQLVFEAVIRSYARGIKDDGSKINTIKKATIFRIITGIMDILFHRVPMELFNEKEYVTPQQRILRTACKSESCYQYVFALFNYLFEEQF